MLNLTYLLIKLFSIVSLCLTFNVDVEDLGPQEQTNFCLIPFENFVLLSENKLFPISKSYCMLLYLCFHLWDLDNICLLLEKR